MAALVEQFSDTTAWSASSGFFPDLLPHILPKVARDRTGRRPALAEPEARGALLTRLVEAEILPRLALARTGRTNAVPADRQAVTGVAANSEEVSRLVHVLLNQETSDAIALIEALHQRGASPEALFLGLVSHTARALGTLWDEDRADFAQVSIGLVRLQQVVRAMSPEFQLGAVRRSGAERVLLLPAPGEHHTFGLVILSEFFRRAGWQVTGGTASSTIDAPDIVNSQWFDVAGFSVGSDVRMEVLAKCIRAVRRASRNRDLGVLVGGPLFVLRPDLVARVGADAAASDAPGAVRQASGLLALRAAAE